MLLDARPRLAIPTLAVEGRLGALDGTATGAPVNVLFVCVRNAGRSQVAEALFARAASGRHAARSAGSSPAAAVHPEVAEVMRELDLEIGGRSPRRLENADAQWADVIVTMGCGDACPYIPGKRYLDWELDDPHGLPLERVREIRDEIGRRVEHLVGELDDQARGDEESVG
ncbi:MAG TPA: arsenate reductase ArsC [Gaiella sp.]|nr:arsenate reductase ArsC [Gaiella sp.]HET9287590.1 arsenate reductase ArsC [Gaiella sp.]